VATRASAEKNLRREQWKKQDRKIASLSLPLYFISIMYENPGSGATALLPPLLTFMGGNGAEMQYQSFHYGN